MDKPGQILEFQVQDQIFAVDIFSVDRVIPAMTVRPVHVKLCPSMLGLINVYGNVFPLLSLRRLAALPDKALDVSDIFIILQYEGRRVGLLADSILGESSFKQEHMTHQTGELSYCENIIAKDNRLIFILCAPTLLNLIEEYRAFDASERLETPHS